MDRIAKVLARRGVASRRKIEEMIGRGLISVNGEVLTTPAFLVSEKDVICVNGQQIPSTDPVEALWIFHKPRGVLTTNYDPDGRPTLFELLPKSMPRVVSVGRLDMMSEGLILLTNSGELSRYLEMPSSNISRKYEVRIFGSVKDEELHGLKSGIEINGVRYGPIIAKVIESGRSNTWISMTLYEGKNREIRRIMEFFGYQVNRLVRTSYGPFDLGDMEPGSLKKADMTLLNIGSRFE